MSWKHLKFDTRENIDIFIALEEIFMVFPAKEEITFIYFS